MKTSRTKAAFTLIELLVMICVVAVLMLVVAFKAKNFEIICMSKQKEVALDLCLFSSDHAGKYPWQVKAADGGSMEFVSSNQVFPHFRTLSDYMHKDARFFVCPTDQARHVATNTSHLLDENISYFLNLDAVANNGSKTSVLIGDRHLEANENAVRHGSFVYSRNTVLDWTPELHTKQNRGWIEEFLFPKPIMPQGVVSFADGHAEIVRTDRLNAVFKKQPVATSRLIVP